MGRGWELTNARDDTVCASTLHQVFTVFPPVEFSRLAEFVLPLVEPGHAQSIFGRNIRTKNLLDDGKGEQSRVEVASEIFRPSPKR